MEYDNTNSGMLRDNDRRRNDRDPVLQGSVNVEGVEYWVSAWQNVGKEGGKEGGKMAGRSYLSLKLRKKDDQPQQAAQPTGGYDWKRAEQATPVAAPEKSDAAAPDDFNDEIPF